MNTNKPAPIPAMSIGLESIAPRIDRESYLNF